AEDGSALIGSRTYTYSHPDYVGKTRELFRLIEQGKEIGLVEGKVVTLDGKVKSIEWTGMLTHFEGKPAVYVMARDITDREVTQQFLRNSEKLTLAGQLAAGIAHEIRNPLTSLKGFLQLMQAQGAGKPEYFQIMGSELNRIEGIVSELLSLAKPTSVQFKESNLVELLQHVVTLLETKAILNNVVIRTNYEVSNAFIHCDENQLKQAFINFIKNGIEAMEDGGEILIELRPSKYAFAIAFVDQGCGISESEMIKLGEPFYTTKHCGTGLGLMMSYNIIKQHHGHVRIESEVQRGTTVTVELPYSCPGK
ncbi:MAG: ATP-binding protein, partial [Clostridia bacterium]